MDLWNNDPVQFARLLSEIAATQDTLDIPALDIPALAEAMDLDISDVVELFDRANAAWETHKSANLLVLERDKLVDDIRTAHCDLQQAEDREGERDAQRDLDAAWQALRDHDAKGIL